jgi:hypothetical protein
VNNTATSGTVNYCAWCGRPLRRRISYGTVGVSHGICPACANAMLKGIQAATRTKED